MKFIFEQQFPSKVVHFTKANPDHAELESEDSGCALIATVTDQRDKDNGMFVRVQSWDDNKEHKDFKNLLGKKVRVTVEVIE